MKVWVYPDKQYVEFGAVRYEVESAVVKASALKRIETNQAKGEFDEVDIDMDVVYRCGYRKTKEAAMKLAQEVYDRDTKAGISAFGSVTVTKQVVDWYVEEDRVAEWANVGDPEYIEDGNSYELWRKEAA